MRLSRLDCRATMTSGQLIRAARLQRRSSRRRSSPSGSGVPRSSIARWEVDTVEPGLLDAPPRAAGLRLRPPARARARSSPTRSSTRGASRRRAGSPRRNGSRRCSPGLANDGPPFDPYAILRALEHGARLLRRSSVPSPACSTAPTSSRTDLDVTPSPAAGQPAPPDGARSTALNAHRVDVRPLGSRTLDPEQRAVWSRSSATAARSTSSLEPAGTRGYDDLRRRANREPTRRRPPPAVADPADLVRMLEAHEVPVRDPHVLPTMRRLLELDRDGVVAQ